MNPRFFFPTVVLAIAIAAPNALGQTCGCGPFLTNSFYVVQAGSVSSPIEGPTAISYLRTCPNNDGGSSLPNNVRIKVVVRDDNGVGIPNIAASDICVLFNGGTIAQGLSGVGADSVIANSQWNTSPMCPDVRCVQADAPTDANGVTYITFAGSTPGQPGVATRDPNRKWGHYDSELPVYVSGIKISGRATSASANGTYTLRIKNFDLTGGLSAQMNQGEAVSLTDFNSVSNNTGDTGPLSYWRDLNSNGSVDLVDVNLITGHQNHNCQYPNAP